jgi:hypothetical protein
MVLFPFTLGPMVTLHIPQLNTESYLSKTTDDCANEQQPTQEDTQRDTYEKRGDDDQCSVHSNSLPFSGPP